MSNTFEDDKLSDIFQNYLDSSNSNILDYTKNEGQVCIFYLVSVLVDVIVIVIIVIVDVKYFLKLS